MTQKNDRPQHGRPDEQHNSGHFHWKQRYPVPLWYQSSHRRSRSHHIQSPDSFHEPLEWQKQASGIFREPLHLWSHHSPAGSLLPYFPVTRDTRFPLSPSYSCHRLTENRNLKNLHLPVLSLYNHGFRFHRKCSLDTLPTYEDKSGSYLSVPLTYDQTGEKSPSDEKHFLHKPFSTQIWNIGKQTK